MVWSYEGIECYVPFHPGKQQFPVFRAWNGKDHFYTTSQAEFEELPTNSLYSLS
ncbi:MAG: hypothetical protein ACE5OZ_15260 [Candidatus Heimdallarchaeota archaeon]